VSTSPRSDVIQWHDRSKIQLLEHIASLEKEVSIESQRATHYREQWQITILAFKEQENTIRSLCENSRRYESDAEASKQRIKRLEEDLNELRSDEARLLNSNGELERRIKLLEEAGDLMVQHFYTDEPRSEMWEKAKEAKP